MVVVSNDPMSPLIVVGSAMEMPAPPRTPKLDAAPRSAATVAVDLGAASSFGVLGGAGISIAEPTTINGDIGSFETTTMTGLGNLTLNGVNHGGDSVTQAGKNDLTIAYNDAAGRPLNVTLG